MSLESSGLHNQIRTRRLYFYVLRCLNDVLKEKLEIEDLKREFAFIDLFWSCNCLVAQ